MSETIAAAACVLQPVRHLSTEENQKNSCTRLELRRLDKDSTRELGAFHSLKLSKKSRRSQESRKDQEHRTALALNKILSKAKKPATTVAKKAIKRLENVKADKPKKAKIPSKGRAVKPEADKPKAEKSKVAQSKQAVHKKKQTLYEHKQRAPLQGHRI
uniref:Uncharacterized protein n=1 Tax=Anas platyrhynchos TaxID=8839 RepID=A0A8B9TDP6_ANAPL